MPCAREHVDLAIAKLPGAPVCFVIVRTIRAHGRINSSKISVRKVPTRAWPQTSGPRGIVLLIGNLHRRDRMSPPAIVAVT